MRLGLIGGTDNKRTSGVYQPEDVVALQDAKKYISRFSYDGVFNALTSSGTEEGFDVSRDGRYVYVAVRGTRTTATIFQYECTTPWDLSTIAYSSKSLVVGDYDLNCNGIAISDDGTRLFFTGYGVDAVWSCTLSTPYDLATATVDVKKFYVGTQDATPRTPFFGDSGTKMYIMGGTNDTVYQYTLSTAWDVSTASYANKSLSVTTLDATPFALFFRDNGTKLYVIGGTNVVILSYTLSTAWDISTATADYVAKSFLVSGQTTTISGVAFDDSGTKMYVMSPGATTDIVFQYTLSTAWDVTTASYANKSVSVNAQATESTDLFFKDDGTKMYILNNITDSIFQYSLSTAWDVSTATYDTVSFSVAGQETVPTGLFFGDSGTKMYVIGTVGDDVNQYALSTAWDISTASFVRASAGTGDTAPSAVFFSSSGDKMFVVGTGSDTVRVFSLSTAWDVSTISFLGYYFAGDATPQGMTFKNDGTEMYIVGDTADRIIQYSLTTAWEPRSVTGRYLVHEQETVPSALFFKPDGTKMYVTGATGDDVNEYDLSTAWNISTASFVRVSATIGEATPTGLWFKDDGTKMYVTGPTNDTVREFSLSTAWNVSTISFVQALSVGFETSPLGVTFKNDGTEIYLVGSTNDVVYEIQLGTAWDISTAKGFIYVGGTESAPRGIHVNNDGTLLFLAGDADNIRKYTLSTAYELGTATLSQSLALTGSFGVHVMADGLRIYATVDNSAANGGRQVRQIAMTSPSDLSTATLSTVELIPLYGLTGAVSTPWGVRVSPDGTRMFVLSDAANQGLHQFSLRFA
jgi:DNA-binding beta-propeller fold protein YncE